MVPYEFAYFAFFGLLIGSFMNVVILRIPMNESIAYPPSHCPSCDTPLKWYHLFPVLSWVFLRGRCGYCQHKISWQYPLVELSVAFIFYVVYMHSDGLFKAGFISLAFTLLFALSVIDYKYLMVPDSLNLLALIFAIVGMGTFEALENALLFAGGFSLLRFSVSFLTQKEAMGEADIMIASTMGAILGAYLGAFSIFVAALLALVVFVFLKNRDIEVPFIPFLSAGVFLVFIFKDESLLFLGRIYG